MLEKDLNLELSDVLQIPKKNFCGEIHSALEVAEHLQEKGFAFQLKDMCPRDMESNMWQAEFVCPDEVTVSEVNEDAARAVCLAAVRAFQIQ